MKNHLPDFVKKRFKVSLDDLPEVEYRVVQHLSERRHISRDISSKSSSIADAVNERASIRRRQSSCNQQQG